MAKRISCYDDANYMNPKEAPYYFENSWRARELWLVDCEMVPCEIKTTIVAKVKV